jgi:hypothetical protein
MPTRLVFECTDCGVLRLGSGSVCECGSARARAIPIHTEVRTVIAPTVPFECGLRKAIEERRGHVNGYVPDAHKRLRLLQAALQASPKPSLPERRSIRRRRIWADS